MHGARDPLWICLAGSGQLTVSDCGGETELLQTRVFFKSRTIHGVSLRKIDRH